MSTTTEPIRSKSQVRQMANFYLKQGKFRNYLLIVMGVHTALRISDLLLVTWGDVYDFDAGEVKKHFYITEKKTGKRKCIAINKAARAAIVMCHTANGIGQGDFLFQSNKGRKNKKAPIGRVQAWRIVKEAAMAVGFKAKISCHSLRKTFGYHAWVAGVSPVLIMDIYNHSSYNVTRRYLGVAQDDLDEVYLGLVIV